MGLPPRVFYTIFEVAARWGCAPADIIGYAAIEQLELVTGVPIVETEKGPISGLVALHGADLMALFRRYGSAPTRFSVKRVRPIGESEWQLITTPAEGLVLDTADIQIMASEIERFEQENQMLPGGRRSSSAQVTYKYDWDAMYVAVIKRIFEHGLPDTQAEFVGEFQEWFARRDPNGDAPDERTIRRRLNPIWRTLREAG